jgi:hypothetical protein
MGVALRSYGNTLAVNIFDEYGFSKGTVLDSITSKNNRDEDNIVGEAGLPRTIADEQFGLMVKVVDYDKHIEVRAFACVSARPRPEHPHFTHRYTFRDETFEPFYDFPDFLIHGKSSPVCVKLPSL